MLIAVACPNCGDCRQVDPRLANEGLRCEGCDIPMSAAAAAQSPEQVARLLDLEGPPTREYTAGTEVGDYETANPGDLADDEVTRVVLGAVAAGFLLYAAERICHALGAVKGPAPFAAGYAFGYVLGFVVVSVFCVGAILAPLSMLGVHLASHLSHFRKPGRLYMRCLAAMLAPYPVMAILGLFDSHYLAGALVAWWATVPAMIVVLWITLRLPIGPFVVTASLVLLCAVWVPVVLGMALATGVSGAFGPQPATAARVAPAPTPTPTSPVVPSIVTLPDVPAVVEARPACAAAEAKLRRIYAAMHAYAGPDSPSKPVDCPPSLEHMVISRHLSAKDATPGGKGIWLYQAAGLPMRLPRGLILVYSSQPIDGYRLCLFADGRVAAVLAKDWEAYYDVQSYRGWQWD